MKEQILAYIRAHPYCRQRYIASACNIWLCDTNFLKCLHDLQKEGLIDYQIINDPANMEFYKEWHLKGENADVEFFS